MQTRYGIRSLRVMLLCVVMVLLVAGCAAPAVVIVSPADGNFEVATGTIQTHPARGDVLLVPGGTAALVSEADKVTMMFNTVDLIPGNVYTAWWVIANDPQSCSDRPCTGGDVIGTPDLVQAEITYADGQVADELGRAEFHGVLQVGEQENGWFGHGFDPTTAEIRVVLHDHGPAIEERTAEMLSSWRGACTEESLNPAFPDVAKADGEVGPNDCIYYQFSVLQAGAME